jgi:hypothetical protein
LRLRWREVPDEELLVGRWYWVSVDDTVSPVSLMRLIMIEAKGFVLAGKDGRNRRLSAPRVAFWERRL